MLPGKGSVVGERFVTHPDVRKIVFTGSTEVGTQVMAGCAAQVKRVTLELGGKSANIVFADCDLEKAAATAPYGVFDNAGQDCCARSRILVQRSVLRPVHGAARAGGQGRRGRRPARRGHRDGPAGLASRTATPCASYVPDDAPVAFRGTAPDGPGLLVPADGADAAARPTARVTEEIFGPVVTVLPFDDEADAIALANDTAYGLSGLDLDRQPRRARCGCRARWKPATCRSTRTRRCATTRRSAASSSPASAASSGPDAPLHFTETKNVFFAIGES